MHVRKSIYLPNEIRVTNMQAPMFGNHKKRNKRIKETSSAVKKANSRHAADHCEAKIAVNFRPHDWHIALTYKITVDEMQSKKDLRNFLNKLKRRCKKLGIDLKYLKMSEIGVRSKKWHHHLILPQEISFSLMYECWEHGQIRILNTLYPDGDFRGLAEYFVDKSKGGQKEDDRPANCSRYSFSRNCEEPIVKYELICSAKWRKAPKPPKGWRVLPDSLYEGLDYAGYRYQKYTLVKIE